MQQSKSQEMPHGKILLNAFVAFIQDRAVQINAIILILAGMDLSDWIKLYAAVIGAIYTTYKLYKEVIKETRWFHAFAKWNTELFVNGYYELVKAVMNVKKQKSKRDGKDNKQPN